MFQSQISPMIPEHRPLSLAWLAEIMTDFPWVAGGTLSTPTSGYRGPGLILQVQISLVEIPLGEVVAGVTGADLEGLEDFSET